MAVPADPGGRFGIHTIDTGFHRPGFDAAYLVVESGRGAFVDCGTNHSAPALLRALAETGLDPADVDWLILTHVHLDHAGGAGELMARLPAARLVVHPRGARHMIDPSKLVAGATAVYGETEMARSYGAIRPVPATRVVEAADGHVAVLAGRALVCVETPGHALHHNAIRDERSNAFFTGDTFGLSYREFDTANGAFVLPTTTPVQFDPDALHASIDKLLGHRPEAMYLTHYGRVGDVPRLAADLHEQIDAMVAIAIAHARNDAADRRAAIEDDLARLCFGRARRHGCAFDEERLRELLGMDIELNAQGLEVWLDRTRDA
jgi:glyoxylase-like metal-dependent hydrolase (beta-lactamase superfamily II)